MCSHSTRDVAAGVDRIAARGKVNKAMIYYHFGSKRQLYLTRRAHLLRTTARARGQRDTREPRLHQEFTCIKPDEAGFRPSLKLRPDLAEALATAGRCPDRAARAAADRVTLAP